MSAQVIDSSDVAVQGPHWTMFATGSIDDVLTSLIQRGAGRGGQRRPGRARRDHITPTSCHFTHVRHLDKILSNTRHLSSCADDEEVRYATVRSDVAPEHKAR